MRWRDAKLPEKHASRQNEAIGDNLAPGGSDQVSVSFRASRLNSESKEFH